MNAWAAWKLATSTGPWAGSEIAAAATLAKARTSAPPDFHDDFQIAAGRKISRYYPTDRLDPEALRAILRQADVGYTFLLMELLDDVASDAHVQSQLARMKLSVAGAPLELVPGDDSDLAQRIAEDAEVFLRRIPKFSSMKINLLDAEFRGIACVLPMWEAIDRKWWVTGWRAIESRFFRFTQNDQPLIETLRAPTGEPIPDGALLHVVQDHAGRVVRGGAFRAVLKPWLYKSYALVDAISFLERFGHPHVQVQLGPEIKEGSPELERAKAAARSFIADQVGLCPPGVTLQILDAVNKAANVDGVYLSVVKWCDAAISKSLLGQTETTEGGDSGGYARAKVHMQVEQSLRELRGQRLDETLTDQLLRPWTLYHYGATAPVPRVHHCVETPEDEKARAETEEIRARTIKAAAHDIGVAIPTRQVRDELRLKEPTKGEDVVGGVVTDATRSNTARRGHAEGVCPNCAATIDLALAEKKKRAASWAT